MINALGDGSLIRLLADKYLPESSLDWAPSSTFDDDGQVNSDKRLQLRLKQVRLSLKSLFDETVHNNCTKDDSREQQERTFMLLLKVRHVACSRD